jgi:hypothetical protein
MPRSKQTNRIIIIVVIIIIIIIIQTLLILGSCADGVIGIVSRNHNRMLKIKY